MKPGTFRSLVLVAFVAVAAPVAAHAGEATKAAPDAKAEVEAFGRLSVDEVAALVASKGADIFDNNGQERFAKGRVPGARHLSIVDIKATDLPAAKDRQLIFYCASEKCRACHTAAKKAIELGYTKVFIMPAGIAGWEKAGKSVDKG